MAAIVGPPSYAPAAARVAVTSACASSMSRAEVLLAAEALRVDLVDVLGARRPAANQPCSVVTLSPPIGAPLPGAAVRIAVIGSPASVVAVTASGESFARTAFCAGVAGASIRR